MSAAKDPNAKRAKFQATIAARRAAKSEPAPSLYTVYCLDGCGQHHTTGDPDIAWNEANAHERALGHRTRVATTPDFERRRRNLPHERGMACEATNCDGPHP